VTLGQRIAAKRGSRSLRQVAAESGVSFSTLSRIETGKDPDLTTLKALCRWLRITPNEALCWPKDEERSLPCCGD
jgi:transcriptional regulator with XRE-family HTH domain